MGTRRAKAHAQALPIPDEAPVMMTTLFFIKFQLNLLLQIKEFSMTIIEVNSKKTIQQFHQLPFQIYKNDKNWIPHIQQEVEAVFTKKK